MAVKIDRKRFFDYVRKNLFKRLSESQVAGMNALLDEIEHRNLTENGYAAYIFATVHHETGGRMVPVTENLNYSAKRIRQVWPSRFKSTQEAKAFANNPEKLANRVYSNRLGNGDEASGDGYKYRGRGLVQPTGKVNYEKVYKMTGVNVVANPELMNDLAVSAEAAVSGMINGLWTGVKLGYFNANDFVPMRAIINADGHANGQRIAEKAHVFAAALHWVNVEEPAPEVEAEAQRQMDALIDTIGKSMDTAPLSIWDRFRLAFARLFS